MDIFSTITAGFGLLALLVNCVVTAAHLLWDFGSEIERLKSKIEAGKQVLHVLNLTRNSAEHSGPSLVDPMHNSIGI